MKRTEYDVIVVGARCAGAPTAMLLARAGHHVLLLDRATFPSDTLSTHLVHPPGVAALQRWGLLDRVVSSGCPAITRYSFDFGPVVIAGRPRPVDGAHDAYAPRRTILDSLLVEAAAGAGAEVRQGFTVEALTVQDGRVTGIRGHGPTGVREERRARVVVGADGRYSTVARQTHPEQYQELAPLSAMYYTYWGELPTDGFETIIRPGRGWAAWPTHDGLTLVVVGWPYAEFEANRADVEGNYLKSLELEPSFAARVASARREDVFRGGAVSNYLRKPFGPGWALVGDAGYNKDPITAQGISDAFRDAEQCASALDGWLTGRQSFATAMGGYQAMRDALVGPIYAFTTQLATLEPPPPEMQRLLAAMQGNQEAMDGFVSVYAGTVSPADFFAPENVETILASVQGDASAARTSSPTEREMPSASTSMSGTVL